MEKYTKTYGICFSRRQKKRFIEALHQDFHALGYRPTMVEGEKLLSHTHNYLYGNMKQVKTVIAVPYDAPERKFWKKVLYLPFDGTRTTNKTMVATYVLIFLFSALIFGGLYGLQPLTTSTGLASLISCGLFLLTVMLMYRMMHGFHNTHSYNRNSATIAAAVEIAKGLNGDEHKKVGLLFIDKNKIRFIGVEAAAKDLANAGKNPTFICLDCIVKDSVVQIGFNPQNHKLINEITKYHLKKKFIGVIRLNEEIRTQNAVAYFKKTVVTSHGELDDAGSLCITRAGTGKDRDIELETLDSDTIMVKEYLHNQE